MSRSLNHSLNNSTSKMRYSFCKASRFLPTIKTQCDIYYDVPNLRSKRSTSLGYGSKTNFSIQSCAPSPSTYTQPSEFDHVKAKGFSFGFGRDETTGGPLAHTRYTKQLPGPGAYPAFSTLENHLITLKPRLPDFTVKRKSYVPGPGAYNPPPSINSSGQYVVSTQASSKAAKFSTSVCIKRPSKASKTPGPGAYEAKQGISREGRYFSSKHMSPLTRSFSKSPRSSLALKHLLKTPGPGTYNPFSQFDVVN